MGESNQNNKYEEATNKRENKKEKWNPQKKERGLKQMRKIIIPETLVETLLVSLEFPKNFSWGCPSNPNEREKNK